MTLPPNARVADRLNEVARLLKEQGANRFRVLAYVRAAQTIRGLERPVIDVVRASGLDGLQNIVGVGEGLARAIRQLVMTGRLPMLERLRGESDPLATLQTVPYVGPTLAARIHEDLGISTLEDLEAAAHDGRLEMLVGMGPKRLAAIRDSLAARLGRLRPLAGSPGREPPSVAELLDVDREYRDNAAAGELPRIAPRRFNPQHEAWLPILHTVRRGRHYTALFSNTARAHRLGKTRDWVVLYIDGSEHELQYTVITAHGGELDGLRTVRGREAECARFYASRAAPRAARSPIPA